MSATASFTGLLRPDADSVREPNVWRSSGGINLHTLIVGEFHSHADTPEHTRTHIGDRHANTRILDGSVYPAIDTRAEDRHICTSGLSCDNRRPNPSGHSGVQPVPMEALDR